MNDRISELMIFEIRPYKDRSFFLGSTLTLRFSLPTVSVRGQLPCHDDTQAANG